MLGVQVTLNGKIKCYNYKLCGGYAEYAVHLFGGNVTVFVCKHCVEDYRKPAAKIEKLKDFLKLGSQRRCCNHGSNQNRSQNQQ